MKGRRKIAVKIIIFVLFPLCALSWSAAAHAGGVYAIHVASYQTHEQAKTDVANHKSEGREAFASEAEIAGRGKWYRVYVGKFDSRQKASAAAAVMKNKRLIDKIFIHFLPQAQAAQKSENSKPDPTAPPSRVSAKNAQAASPVIGNTDTKRYHLPGMPFYGKVKKHHRIVFSSEQEAIDKGYYKAGTERDVQRSGQKTVAQSQPSSRNAPPEKTPPPPATTSVVDQLKAAREKLTKKTEHTAQGQSDVKAAPSSPATASVVDQLKAAKERISGKKTRTAPVQAQEDRKTAPPPPPMTEAEKDKEEAFKEPDEKDIVEPASDSAIYTKALGELKEKKYEQALVTFKEYISRPDTPKEWGQRALRHMADCHYWLGRDGKKEELLIAAEFYKNTLENFPDPRKENALTYYRLAKTYEHMKYYPEAVKQYQNLTKKYPDSPYVPEAYYKIGEIYYQDGKYNEAAEGFVQYLMKYRGRAHTKKSYYLVAHSYYKAKQSTNAEMWFRDAMQKWPDMSSIPKDIIIDYGAHKISMLRFEEGAAAFSLFVNLYPSDPRTKDVMMSLADAYSRAGQAKAALAVYHKILEKYPESPEAGKSALAMAGIGVDAPGLKVFRAIDYMDYYRNPVDTYDDLIMRHEPDELAQDAMLAKAGALVKKGQGRKAADVYLEFLSLYPESKRLDDAAKGLKSASAALIDEYFAKKDYLAVAYVYFRSFGAVPLLAEEYPQVQKIAQSLKHLNFMDDYTRILQKYLGVAGDEATIHQVSVDIAHGMIAQGKYDEAEKILQSVMMNPGVRKSALMTAVRKNLADIAYKREQYDQAAANYSAMVQSAEQFQDTGKIYSRYAHSLKEQKDYAQALQNYLTAVKYLDPAKPEKNSVGVAYNEIGDLYLKVNNPAKSLSMYEKALETAKNEDVKMWAQFQSGNTYLKLSKDEQAQNIFTQMKTAAGPESFWAKIVDFYAADTRWWEKYGSVINK